MALPDTQFPSCFCNSVPKCFLFKVFQADIFTRYYGGKAFHVFLHYHTEEGITGIYHSIPQCQIYLVDISKRSLTELTLQPMAPHLSSSCSQSETDSYQFMWAFRRRLLRNCFISGGRKRFKRFMSCKYCCMVLTSTVYHVNNTFCENRPSALSEEEIRDGNLATYNSESSLQQRTNL